MNAFVLVPIKINVKVSPKDETFLKSFKRLKFKRNIFVVDKDNLNSSLKKFKPSPAFSEYVKKRLDTVDSLMIGLLEEAPFD